MTRTRHVACLFVSKQQVSYLTKTINFGVVGTELVYYILLVGSRKVHYYSMYLLTTIRVLLESDKHRLFCVSWIFLHPKVNSDCIIISKIRWSFCSPKASELHSVLVGIIKRPQYMITAILESPLLSVIFYDSEMFWKHVMRLAKFKDHILT